MPKLFTFRCGDSSRILFRFFGWVHSCPERVKAGISPQLGKICFRARGPDMIIITLDITFFLRYIRERSGKLSIVDLLYLHKLSSYNILSFLIFNGREANLLVTSCSIRIVTTLDCVQNVYFDFIQEHIAIINGVY